MPIFYLDSGSIDRLEISSSLLVSGTLVVSGSLQNTGGLTGSLLGTASFANTASLATTASYYQLVTGSTGSDFNIATSPSGSILNIPDASSTARGLVTTQGQTFAGLKQFGTVWINTSAAIYNSLFRGNTGGNAERWAGQSNNVSYITHHQEIDGATISSNNTWITSRVSGPVTLTEGTSGTHNLISNVGIKQLNVANGTATTTNYATLYIEGAISGTVTPTDGNYALWVDSGSTRLDGDLIMSGSNIIATGSIYASQGFTGSLSGTASFAVSASWAPTILAGGQDQYITRWEGTDTITTSSLYEGANKNIGINTTTFDATNPEALLVSASSFNAISGEANINTYVQLNIINNSNGAQSSADIVATNNAGTEFGNYVDLGINGSNYGGALGAPNEAYLFNTGSNFIIGNTTRGANGNLKLFAGNDGTIFPVIVTGSIAILTGSLLGTASFATTAATASSIGQLNQQVVITGSVILSSSVSTQNELTVIGQTVITGSLIVSGTLGSGVFSKGGTIADVVNLVSVSGSYYVWRAPFSASVVAVYGRREAGSSTLTSVNARRSSSAGYALHTGSNLVLGTDQFWSQTNTVENRNYAPGDSLEIIISGSANKQVAVQVDFIKL